MCFRPATASSTIQCPQCGSANPDFAMICIECDYDLSELTKDTRAALLGSEPIAPKAVPLPKEAPAPPCAPTIAPPKPAVPPKPEKLP